MHVSGFAIVHHFVFLETAISKGLHIDDSKFDKLFSAFILLIVLPQGRECCMSNAMLCFHIHSNLLSLIVCMSSDFEFIIPKASVVAFSFSRVVNPYNGKIIFVFMQLSWNTFSLLGN